MEPVSATVLYYLYFTDLFLPGPEISVQVKTPNFCAAACNQRTHCVSFFYNPAAEVCTYFPKGISDKDTQLVNQTGAQYFIPDAGLKCMRHQDYQYPGPGLCLKYVTTPLSWSDAFFYCSLDKSTLVLMQKESTQKYFQQVNKSFGDFWLGASDVDKPGSWVWQNGAPVEDNKNWQQNASDGNCLLMHEQSWVGANCSLTKNFICQI